MNNKQNKGLKRNTIDKFYTNNETVNLCKNYILENIEINENDIIIEPSAGDGSFIQMIKSLNNNYIFYDIEPENNEIIECDFLHEDFNLDNIINRHQNIHFIGNPPFGRQSSTAIKFIKRCSLYAKTIAFILPKSFKKNSMQKHFPSKFHLKFQIDIPDNSFRINNDIIDVPCIFQIWEKKDIDRIFEMKIEEYGFEFVKKNENPDISFRRVGVNAGYIDELNLIEKSEQSHYFIRIKIKNKKECIQKLKTLVYENNNTVGPRSISKQELIPKFNEITHQFD